MSQSLAQVYIHLVFSTKHQRNLIDPKIERELHPYLAKLFRECDSPSLCIDGTENHIHCLFSLARRITVSQVVEKVKKTSSKWIKSKGERYRNFYWQGGYGAFSISPSGVKEVIRYIANQKRHHIRQTFREEFINILDKHGVEYDERYMWD